MDNFSKKNVYTGNLLLKTAFCGGVMLLALCVILGITPFGDSTFLTGDLNGQYISYFAQFRNALIEGNGITYSLQKSIGGSMMGIVAYNASGPFVLLYALVDPIYYGILTTPVVCLKILLACISMAFFLSKKLKTQNNRIILSSLAYGFSGYVIIFMQNFMWHDVLILLPLLCYGVDLLMETKKPYVYCLSLFAAVFFNFYIAYMVCIFLVLYFIYNLLQLKQLSLKTAFAHCIRFAASSVLGGLMSAVLLFPALADVFQGKGIGNETFGFSTEFSVWQFLARLLPFGFNWQNLSDDLPNVYAGIITIILTIIFFLAQNIGLKQKLLSAAILLFLFLSMWLTNVMLIFHGFAEPVWFTHRHSFLFVFWACFLAATAFIKGAFSAKTLAVTLFVTGVILGCRIFFEEGIYTQNRLLFTIAIIIFIFLLLLLYIKTPTMRNKEFAVSIMLIALMVELLINVYYIQMQFEQYPDSEYRSFVEDNTELISEIHALEGHDNFRIEKSTHRSLNDSFLLNYYGVTHFGSIQDDNSLDFIYSMGLTGNIASTIYNSSESNIFSDSLLGIKYLLVQQGDPVPSGYEPTSIEKNGITVYQNPYAFPIAFLLPDAESYNIESDDNIYFQNDVFQLLKGDDTIDFSGDSEPNLQLLEELSLTVKSEGANVDLFRGELHADIETSRDGMLFFSIPYSKHLSVTVNSIPVETRLIFNSQLGVPVSKGENVVKIVYDTPMLTLGITVSLICAGLLIALKLYQVYICKRLKKRPCF